MTLKDETAMLDPLSKTFERVTLECADLTEDPRGREMAITLTHADALDLCPEHKSGKLGRCFAVTLHCFECSVDGSTS
jgi:hypothetical protein